jgi:predicted O-methyltransferase YrrM
MEINKQNVEQINLSDLSINVIEDQFRDYFLGNPGEEHYKLLSWFSTKFKNQTLLDIGTYKGCSALALSYNTENKVVSFDIREDLKQLYSAPSNIQFIVDDCLKEQYNTLILNSPFILLDTDHDGIFEKQFLEYLQKNKYRGSVMFDDIYLNDIMIEFWNSIKEEKFDISHVGHYTGTGLVIFK